MNRNKCHVIDPSADSRCCSFVKSGTLTVAHDDSNAKRHISGCDVAANRCHCQRSFRLCSKWLVVPSRPSPSPCFFDTMTHRLSASSLVFHKRPHQGHITAAKGVSTLPNHKITNGTPYCRVLKGQDRTRQVHHLEHSYYNVTLHCWKQNKRNR